MATTYHKRSEFLATRRSRVDSLSWLAPIGRFLFAIMFVLAGINHFSSGSIGYAASQGVPMADILVPVSGVMAFVGGLSVILGYHAKVGALILLLFLFPVTFIMHDFWNVTDPEAAQMQMTNFLKNISMMGGAFLILFYGAGPVSFDQSRKL